MVESKKTTDNRNLHATILSVLGIIFVIIGAGIITIHNPLRGSGLGTASIVLGIVLLIIAVLRFVYKRT